MKSPREEVPATRRAALPFSASLLSGHCGRHGTRSSCSTSQPQGDHGLFTAARSPVPIAGNATLERTDTGAMLWWSDW